jgi:hypothetical protein
VRISTNQSNEVGIVTPIVVAQDEHDGDLIVPVQAKKIPSTQ